MWLGCRALFSNVGSRIWGASRSKPNVARGPRFRSDVGRSRRTLEALLHCRPLVHFAGMEKRLLTRGQLVNMSFGFLGIQFGWGLQLANMSAVYERLGAKPDEVPLLWLAAPVTGLLVQPIVGALSDRTWGALGRRRPYFLAGAILASIALFVMPTSTSIWMAASLLWILDASINISMEPFRAFVADKLVPEQRTS